jgi:hypothetical protein
MPEGIKGTSELMFEPAKEEKGIGHSERSVRTVVLGTNLRH